MRERKQTVTGNQATERIAEIGVILAAGLIRMRMLKSSRLSADDGESSLDFSPAESGHPTRTEGRTTDG